MTNEVKHILHIDRKNVYQKDVYQIGEGKDALTFSISTGETTYISSGYFLGSELEPANFVELNLSRDGLTLYNIIQNDREDNTNRPGLTKYVDTDRVIAEKLYGDFTEEGIAVKRFLKQIRKNPLVDSIRKQIKDIYDCQERELVIHKQTNDIHEHQEGASAVYKQIKTEILHAWKNLYNR